MKQTMRVHSIRGVIGGIVVVVAALMLGATNAQATPINWTLGGVTFDDGGTASGTFSTDSATGDLISFDIVTTAGSTLGGAIYDVTTAIIYANNFFSPNSFLLATNNSGLSPYLNLAFLNPLTSPGIDPIVLGLLDGHGDGDVSGSWECNDCDPSRNVISGVASASAVPEPSTLALFGGGLLGLGALRRRRKAEA